MLPVKLNITGTNAVLTINASNKTLDINAKIHWFNNKHKLANNPPHASKMIIMADVIMCPVPYSPGTMLLLW